MKVVVMMTWRICDVLVVVVVRILARASLGGAERRLTTCVECPKLELAGTATMCKFCPVASLLPQSVHLAFVSFFSSCQPILSLII